MNETKLIIEAVDSDDLPLRFRRTTAPLPQPQSDRLNLQGFAELRASGSGQFSLGGLRRIRREIGEGRAIIVDLRQESHGFVNGIGVSWFGKHNYGNIGLSNAEVRRDEDDKLQRLMEASSFQFDYIEGKSAAKIDEPVCDPKVIQTEEQLAAQEGFGYQRFYVTDHHRPSDEEVDRFIRFMKSLPPDIWLHYHCRGGVGRTSTFLLMQDMMRNAKDVPLADMLKRHILNGGRDMYRLYDDHENYKQEPALERIAFIERFYEYCLAVDDGFETSWSQWLSTSRQGIMDQHIDRNHYSKGGF